MFKELDNRLKKIEQLLQEHHYNDAVFLNADEASKFVKLKKSYIYQLTYERKIPHYKPGKNLLFKKSELVEWIELRKKDTLEKLYNRVFFNYKD